jgi:hypothetical protein
MRVRNPEDDRGGGIGTREGSEKSDGTWTDGSKRWTCLHVDLQKKKNLLGLQQLRN